jgi:hypothetical protein
LGAEAVQIAEYALVDKADQSVQFQQGILERRCRQQDLVRQRQCIAQDAGGLVLRLIDVAQAMGFVDDHQVPRHGLHVLGFACRELIGADEYGGAVACEVERVCRTVLDGLAVGPGFKQAGGDTELVCQFLMPLLAQVGRGDDQNAALALGPFLRDQQACFDGFAETDFVGKDGAPGQRVARREQRGVDLVRVQVDLSIQQRTGHAVHGIGRGTAGQLMREIRELVRAVGHRLSFFYCYDG